MLKLHVEMLWTVLLTDTTGKTRFLAVLDSIVTRTTQRKCRQMLREWRRFSNSPRAGRVVKVRVAMVG
jgi:hypothetical protein